MESFSSTKRTPSWEDGKPEGYSAEAATRWWESCLDFKDCTASLLLDIKKIWYVFLPTNEGLSRRFPQKFVLSDVSPDDMILIFKRQLLLAQDMDVPHGRNVTLLSERYFSSDAYDYLKLLIKESMQGDVTYREEDDPRTRKQYSHIRTFRPRWYHMYRVFEHQAGSMAILADEAVTVLSRRSI